MAVLGRWLLLSNPSEQLIDSERCRELGVTTSSLSKNKHFGALPDHHPARLRSVSALNRNYRKVSGLFRIRSYFRNRCTTSRRQDQPVFPEAKIRNIFPIRNISKRCCKFLVQSEIRIFLLNYYWLNDKSFYLMSLLCRTEINRSQSK